MKVYVLHNLPMSKRNPPPPYRPEITSASCTPDPPSAQFPLQLKTLALLLPCAMNNRGIPYVPACKTRSPTVVPEMLGSARGLALGLKLVSGEGALELGEEAKPACRKWSGA